MKRLMVLIVVLALMISAAAVVSADPIGVGGMLSSSARVTTFSGKGVPQGVPFIALNVSMQLGPIGVGGM